MRNAVWEPSSAKSLAQPNDDEGIVGPSLDLNGNAFFLMPNQKDHVFQPLKDRPADGLVAELSLPPEATFSLAVQSDAGVQRISLTPFNIGATLFDRFSDGGCLFGRRKNVWAL